MNLATRWNLLYWQCACLCINSGSYVDSINPDEDTEDGEESNDIAEEGDEANEGDAKKKTTAPDYAKISKAIVDMQLAGVDIDLPDINKAQTDFIPDIQRNSILYGLKAVTCISETLAQDIIANRPYSSMEDFLTKVSVTCGQMMGLIKAGCFDALCKKPRGTIMRDYLNIEAEKKVGSVEKITMVQIKKAISLKWSKPEFRDAIRTINFKRYIDQYQHDSANKRYILSEEKTLRFFSECLQDALNASKNDFSMLPGGKVALKESAFKKAYERSTGPLVAYLNTPEGKQEYKDLLKQNFVQELMETKCGGSLAHWEMETMSFYHTRHELAGVNREKYGISKFSSLPEQPTPDSLTCLVGTVAGRDNKHHIVNLLTPDGMVDVKFYADFYNDLNKQISVLNGTDKKKTVVERSWFERGTLLAINGVRRENLFYASKKRDKAHPTGTSLIEEISADGILTFRGRKKI